MTRPTALLLALVLLACGSGPDLGTVVLTQPPSGYHASSASGSLDAAAAADATPADSSAVQQYLSHHGFNDGYSEVWQSGSDFITIVALRFDDPSGAQGLVALELKQLRNGATDVVTDLRMASAATYVFYGKTRLRGHEVFCAGEVFPESRLAFVVTTCSAFPNSAGLARQLALDQYLKAQRVLKLAIAAPANPSPTQ